MIKHFSLSRKENITFVEINIVDVFKYYKASYFSTSNNISHLQILPMTVTKALHHTVTDFYQTSTLHKKAISIFRM